MLELRQDGTSRAGLRDGPADALLSVRKGGDNVAYLPGLFGKRVGESRAGGNATPISSPPEVSIAATDTEFVCNSFGMRDSYLFFLRVKISDREMRALLDSGSSRTFLGPESIQLVKDLGFRFRPARDRRVTTATNQTTRVRGGGGDPRGS